MKCIPRTWSCLLAAALLALAPLNLRAEDACCPPEGEQAKPAAAAAATQPAHDDCPTCAAEAAATAKALPPGHPPMAPASGKALPPGHPPTAGGPAQALPPGHPPMDAAAQTQPADMSVSLAIKAVQKSASGPAVAGDKVTIEVYSRSAEPKTIAGELDSHGVLLLEDLTVPTGSQALITVHHAGVDFQAVVPRFTAQSAHPAVEVSVYESSEQPVAWKLKAWHIMAQQTKQGLRVSEMFVVENPTDRAFLGTASEKGPRTSLLLPVPPRAAELRLGRGFQDCCQASDGQIVVATPLLPGMSQFQVSYLIPLEKETALLELTSPAKVETMMIMLPEDGTKVATTGTGSAKVMEHNKNKVRIYQETDLDKGKKLSISVTGVPQVAQAADGDVATSQASTGAPAAPAATAVAPKAIAGIGAALIVAVAVVIMLSRPRKPQTKQADAA